MVKRKVYGKKRSTQLVPPVITDLENIDAGTEEVVTSCRINQDYNEKAPNEPQFLNIDAKNGRSAEPLLESIESQCLENSIMTPKRNPRQHSTTVEADEATEMETSRELRRQNMSEKTRYSAESSSRKKDYLRTQPMKPIKSKRTQMKDFTKIRKNQPSSEVAPKITPFPSKHVSENSSGERSSAFERTHHMSTRQSSTKTDSVSPKAKRAKTRHATPVAKNIPENFFSPNKGISKQSARHNKIQDMTYNLRSSSKKRIQPAKEADNIKFEDVPKVLLFSESSVALEKQTPETNTDGAVQDTNGIISAHSISQFESIYSGEKIEASDSVIQPMEMDHIPKDSDVECLAEETKEILNEISNVSVCSPEDSEIQYDGAKSAEHSALESTEDKCRNLAVFGEKDTIETELNVKYNETIQISKINVEIDSNQIVDYQILAAEPVESMHTHTNISNETLKESAEILSCNEHSEMMQFPMFGVRIGTEIIVSNPFQNTQSVPVNHQNPWSQLNGAPDFSKNRKSLLKSIGGNSTEIDKYNNRSIQLALKLAVETDKMMETVQQEKLALQQLQKDMIQALLE